MAESGVWGGDFEMYILAHLGHCMPNQQKNSIFMKFGTDV